MKSVIQKIVFGICVVLMALLIYSNFTEKDYFEENKRLIDQTRELDYLLEAYLKIRPDTTQFEQPLSLEDINDLTALVELMDNSLYAEFRRHETHMLYREYDSLTMAHLDKQTQLYRIIGSELNEEEDLKSNQQLYLSLTIMVLLGVNYLLDRMSKKNVQNI